MWTTIMNPEPKPPKRDLRYWKNLDEFWKVIEDERDNGNVDKRFE